VKEIPIGRTGVVVDGEGLGRQVDDAKSEIRCNECRGWFDSRMFGCPDCGLPRPAFSKAIRTAQLNRHLYEQAGLRPKSGDFRL
jgi:hypothetical protein